MKMEYLHAREATTPILNFRLHLQNASRVNMESGSNRELRRLLRDPHLLDALEQALQGRK